MKKSICVLSISAALMIGVAVGISIPSFLIQPTAMVYAPVEEKTMVVGGGISAPMLQPTDRRSEILHLAAQIATKHGNPHGKLLQAILLQETQGGTAPGYTVTGPQSVNKRNYGVGQIRLITAKEVLKYYPEMLDEHKFHTDTDEEIIGRLITDDEFNIAVASKYILLLKDRGFKTARQIAIAYQYGPSGARGLKTSRYSESVMKKIMYEL